MPLHRLEQLLLSTVANKKITQEAKINQLKAIVTSIQKIRDIERAKNAETIAAYETLEKATGITSTLDEILPGLPNIDAYNEQGHTALMIAAQTGDLECLQILTEAGSNIHLRSKVSKNDALMFAVISGHAQCLNFLLEHGADKNAQNNHGDTPLILAIYHNQMECFLSLVKAKCNPDIKDVNGHTALIVAASGEGDPNKSEAKDKAVVSYIHHLITDLGVDINAQTKKNGNTALHEAVGCEYIPGVQALLKYNPDLTIVGEYDRTARDLIIARNNPDILELFIKQGAQVKITISDIIKNHRYTYDRSVEMIALLLKYNHKIQDATEFNNYLNSRRNNYYEDATTYCREALQKQIKTNQLTKNKPRKSALVSLSSLFGFPDQPVKSTKLTKPASPVSDRKEQSPLLYGQLHDQSEISQSTDQNDAHSQIRRRSMGTGFSR